MAVKISNLCAYCGVCKPKCPVDAITDKNPMGEKTYYVNPDKCIECVGFSKIPECANVCPSVGCIVWDSINPKRPKIKTREGRHPVIS